MTVTPWIGDPDVGIQHGGAISISQDHQIAVVGGKNYSIRQFAVRGKLEHVRSANSSAEDQRIGNICPRTVLDSTGYEDVSRNGYHIDAETCATRTFETGSAVPELGLR